MASAVGPAVTDVIEGSIGGILAAMKPCTVPRCTSRAELDSYTTAFRAWQNDDDSLDLQGMRMCLTLGTYRTLLESVRNWKDMTPSSHLVRP